MDFWGWVLLIVIAGVGIAIVQAVSVSNKKKAMEEKLKSLPDFSPTQKIMGNNGDTGLAIDENRTNNWGQSKVSALSAAPRAGRFSQALLDFLDELISSVVEPLAGCSQ